jgi:hypothetical protein
MLTYQTEMTIPLSHLKAEILVYSELIKHGAMGFRQGFFFFFFFFLKLYHIMKLYAACMLILVYG